MESLILVVICLLSAPVVNTDAQFQKLLCATEDTFLFAKAKLLETLISPGMDEEMVFALLGRKSTILFVPEKGGYLLLYIYFDQRIDVYFKIVGQDKMVVERVRSWNHL